VISPKDLRSRSIQDAPFGLVSFCFKQYFPLCSSTPSQAVPTTTMLTPTQTPTLTSSLNPSPAQDIALETAELRDGLLDVEKERLELRQQRRLAKIRLTKCARTWCGEHEAGCSYRHIAHGIGFSKTQIASAATKDADLTSAWHVWDLYTCHVALVI